MHKLLFLVLAIFAGSYIFAAENRITDVKVVEGPRSTDLIIDSAVEPDYVVVKGKNFVQFDIKDSSFHTIGSPIAVYKHNLRFYRVDELSNPAGILRIRVFIKDYAKYDVKTSATKLIVSVYNDDVADAILDPELQLKVKQEEELRKREEQARSYYVMGNAALKERDWEKAYKYYQEANTLDPANVDILEAMQLARNNLLLQKQYEADFQIGMDYFRTGDFRNAIIEFEKFLEKYPGVDKALYYLGQAAMKEGDYKKANAAFKKLIKVSPTFDHISNVYSWLREMTSKIKSGIASDKNVSFRAKDEKLRDVLTALVYGTGIRIIVPDSVNFTVDVDLDQVPLFEAIESILADQGLRYKKDGSTIEVLERGEGGKLVDGLQFRGLPLKNVLEILAELMKINLVIDESIDKNRPVTFYIKNSKISVQDLFDLVLKTNNLVATKYNDTTYFIVDKIMSKEYNYEKKYQKVFYFTNIKPLEFINILYSIKELRERLNFRNIKVVDIDNSNFGIVSAEKRNLMGNVGAAPPSPNPDRTGIPDYVKSGFEYDVENPAYIEAEKKKAMGGDEKDDKLSTENIPQYITKEEPFAGTISQKNVDVEGYGGKVKALIAYETKANLDLIEELIKKFDVKRRQVLIAMKVLEVTNRAKEELGFENTFDGTNYLGIDNKVQAQAINVKRFKSLDKLEFASTLKMLEQKNQAHTLSNPTVRVVDGHEATVDVITTQRILTKDMETFTVKEKEEDGTTTDRTERRLVDSIMSVVEGILLKVKPVVHDDDEITVSLGMDSTSLGGFNTDNMAIINIKNTNTVVRIKNGETIVIGGLIDGKKNDNQYSTPFLSKLPILGNLFKKNEKDDERRELILLVTPYLVNEDSKIEEIASSEGWGDDELVERISKLKDSLRN